MSQIQAFVRGCLAKTAQGFTTVFFCSAGVLGDFGPCLCVLVWWWRHHCMVVMIREMQHALRPAQTSDPFGALGGRPMFQMHRLV